MCVHTYQHFITLLVKIKTILLVLVTEYVKDAEKQIVHIKSLI